MKQLPGALRFYTHTQIHTHTHTVAYIPLCEKVVECARFQRVCAHHVTVCVHVFNVCVHIVNVRVCTFSMCVHVFSVCVHVFSVCVHVFNVRVHVFNVCVHVFNVCVHIFQCFHPKRPPIVFTLNGLPYINLGQAPPPSQHSPIDSPHYAHTHITFTISTISVLHHLILLACLLRALLPKSLKLATNM